MNEPGRVSVCKVRHQKSLRISDVLFFASKKESGNLGKDNEKSSKQRQEV